MKLVGKVQNVILIDPLNVIKTVKKQFYITYVYNIAELGALVRIYGIVEFYLTIGIFDNLVRYFS